MRRPTPSLDLTPRRTQRTLCALPALPALCALLALCVGCKPTAPESEPILQLTQAVTETIDAHPDDCDALGRALRPQLSRVDKALSLQLRRLGVSAHQLDDSTRASLDTFARKFAAASQRCRASEAFKEALAALEGQLDER